VSLHPLIELSTNREVKQAKGFKQAAAELNGEKLEALYQQEVGNAPRRGDEDKKFLDVKTGRVPTGRQAGKDDRHLALAVAAWAKATGEGVEMPAGDKLEIVDSTVPLRTAAPDRSKGDDDPNKGVEDIDLIGLLPDERMAIITCKFLAPDATRGGAGDTPLRALLSGLAQAAMCDANRASLTAEIQDATGRTVSDEAPALILAASPKYWELCRKREAQKGAGWIRELERLGREIAETIGVEVFFVAIEIEGNPGWEYQDGGPLLDAAPDLNAAWEVGAGKLKPKPKSRAKKSDPAAELVEADLSREPRAYAISDSYTPGDRIEHSKLGTGVVQGVVGRGKISVLFGEDAKLLVHERPVRA
jgi:hypothetical protein